MTSPPCTATEKLAERSENARRAAIDATGYTAGEIHAETYEKKGLFHFGKKKD